MFLLFILVILQLNIISGHVGEKPTTFKELTEQEIKDARIEKAKTGRAKKFDKYDKNKNKIN